MSAAAAALLVACTAQAPYRVMPDVFAPALPDLGLAPAPGTATFTVFRPDANDDRFSNGAVPVAFKGRLYVQWQSSTRDEDAADTWVAYSRSDDGLRWSSPAVLAPSGAGPAMRSSGGWWTDGEVLVAYANVWPQGFRGAAGGFTEYRLSRDGEQWSPPRRVLDAAGRPFAGVIEQDPHALADGRIVTAFHVPPGLTAVPYFTDDPLGVSGWTRGAMPDLPHDGRSGRALEPSLFLQGRCIVMVFRDQASSFRQLASRSCDRGATWSRPVVTTMPDARAKQSAGNLADGTAFLVNAPNAGRERIPLALTLAGDGRRFDRAFLLRGHADLQPLRFEGRYKRPGYHYPKSVVWQDHLYVAYATNKEDVEVTRVPLASLDATRSAGGGTNDPGEAGIGEQSVP
ncbi:sialidase family protein [Coralloluteibacterium stylophorae]